MKKAVFAVGGKQYLVIEGQVLDVELLKDKNTSVSFDALLIIDGDKVTIGRPLVDGAKIVADIVDPEVKADKVVAIRYKAKKRVHKVRSHRQHHTVLKITKIL
jgi:large subunit ribosomal protein L21